MKTRSLVALLLLFTIVSVSGQKLSIELTFTAVKSGEYAQLDSIKVMNRSQGSENTIYYPDTTLSLEITPGDALLYIGYITGFPVGVHENYQKTSQFQLFQSFPNPVKDQCLVSMYLPDDGKVNIRVIDIHGKVNISEEEVLEKGIQSFHFSPGSSPIYFLSASWKNFTEITKIINAEPAPGMCCKLCYAESGKNDYPLKASLQKSGLVVLESGIPDTPATNETITFQFATNIPCPGTPTVQYEGTVYNTIQIFSQCWLKENLNVGVMINGNQDQTDNGIIEKYCYDNNPDSCTKYGGLYQWEEMMQYSAQQGAGGICPPGWHLPTDEEWMVLEGTVDSQYGIGDSIWRHNGGRGTDVGTNLKTTSGWNENGSGTDLYGFSGLPGGECMYDHTFNYIGHDAFWWTSTEQDPSDIWHRLLDSNYPDVRRNGWYKIDGHSVRCIRDF